MPNSHAVCLNVCFLTCQMKITMYIGWDGGEDSVQEHWLRTHHVTWNYAVSLPWRSSESEEESEINRAWWWNVGSAAVRASTGAGGLWRKSPSPARAWGWGGLELTSRRTERWSEGSVLCFGEETKITAPLAIMLRTWEAFWVMGSHRKVWYSDKVCWCAGKYLAHSWLSINVHLQFWTDFIFSVSQESPCTSVLDACEVIHDETFNAVERALNQELGDLS